MGIKKSNNLKKFIQSIKQTFRPWIIFHLSLFFPTFVCILNKICAAKVAILTEPATGAKQTCAGSPARAHRTLE